jgi:hypothetical protein
MKKKKIPELKAYRSFTWTTINQDILSHDNEYSYTIKNLIKQNR